MLYWLQGNYHWHQALMRVLGIVRKWVAMSRLLLLACSERKRLNPGQLPAIERYDGPAYRVLRRYVQSAPLEIPDVYILSAQYGLIPGDQPISAYDRLMTPERAQELLASTASRLQQLEPGKRYRYIFIHAGAVYRDILSSPVLDALSCEQIRTATGSQGVQLAHLRSWLYDNGTEPLKSGTTADTVALESATPLHFKLRGCDNQITVSEVIAVARQALENEMINGLRATAWYVLVDGRRIPPKWLVSQLTGMPVGEFHSIEARRVLTQLGLIARQV
jgi:uncharacterized protein DUF6884